MPLRACSLANSARLRRWLHRPLRLASQRCLELCLMRRNDRGPQEQQQTSLTESAQPRHDSCLRFPTQLPMRGTCLAMRSSKSGVSPDLYRRLAAMRPGAHGAAVALLYRPGPDETTRAGRHRSSAFSSGPMPSASHQETENCQLSVRRTDTKGKRTKCR